MLRPIIIHEAKSKYAYVFSKGVMHLRLKALKDSTKKIQVIYGDPFNWKPSTTSDKWVWQNNVEVDLFMKKEYVTEDFDHYFSEVKFKYNRAKYAFLIDDTFIFGCHGLKNVIDNPDELTKIANFFTFPYMNEEDAFSPPPWLENQVWYSIFTDRFSKGELTGNKTDFLDWHTPISNNDTLSYGGNLQGVLERLEYIKNIGFTGIYFTPIFEAMSPHKYDTIDYFSIDSDFGNNEIFAKIVEKAHSLGMKVMLDAVFNHCGFDHPFFKDVREKGSDSSYYDCFHIIDDNKPVFDFELDGYQLIEEDQSRLYNDPSLLNYRVFGFTPFMPKLNTNNSIIQNYLFDVAKFWLIDNGVDGLRLDVSNEVSHHFWRLFRNKVKSLDNLSALVGENWDNSYPWLHGDQHDSVMNYEILQPMWEFFGTSLVDVKISATEFMYQINKVLTDYPKNVLKVLYNLVDSHDTARIYDVCSKNEDLVKLVYLFMFSFPGTPSVFYGSEINLEGNKVPLNRSTMDWEKTKENTPMTVFLKRLIRLKRDYSGFNTVDFDWKYVNDEKGVIVFRKENLIFLINNSTNTEKIELPTELQKTKCLNIFDLNLVKLDEYIELKSYGFNIFEISY